MVGISHEKHEKTRKESCRIFLCLFVPLCGHLIGGLKHMRWILIILSAVVALVSLLTVVRAPDWVWTWKLAILAGEYGHWLVLLPAGLALAVCRGTAGVWRAAVLALCLAAAGFFLRPVLSARRIAATLPADMHAAFGPGASSSVTFSLGRLYLGPRTPQVKVTTEIFARPDGEELKLDYYAPPFVADTTRRPPCLVVIHGGGWDAGDRTQLADWNYRWAARGCAVAAIEYRLAPRWQWPAPKEDALAALAWLKTNAGHLGFDAARLVLLGRSAGAQIAEVAGYAAHDPAIRGVIAYYGPSDMVFGYQIADEDDAIRSPSLMRAYLGGTPAQRPARYDDASALRFVGPGSPPTLILHGRLDTLASPRHAERLAARLAEAGVPHYYLSLPWATHGFDYNPDGPGGQLADYAIDSFLRTVAAP
jgi:acetyl esterase/lipase